MAQAHPRACGENAAADFSPASRPGSSPRVRGKRPRDPHPQSKRRLIPARAGKTFERLLQVGGLRAHPRACGENNMHYATLSRRLGSSPRVRGKLGELRQRDQHNRLIPARAGKTRREWYSLRDCRAHPRACGENLWHPRGRMVRLGSSPRVRGKPQVGESTKDDDGLIPARAGKTWGRIRYPQWFWAHPRACGENCPAIAIL